MARRRDVVSAPATENPYDPRLKATLDERKFDEGHTSRGGVSVRVRCRRRFHERQGGRMKSFRVRLAFAVAALVVLAAPASALPATDPSFGHLSICAHVESAS